jgi:hypothetical protein
MASLARTHFCRKSIERCGRGRNSFISMDPAPMTQPPYNPVPPFLKRKMDVPQNWLERTSKSPLEGESSKKREPDKCEGDHGSFDTPSMKKPHVSKPRNPPIPNSELHWAHMSFANLIKLPIVPRTQADETQSDLRKVLVLNPRMASTGRQHERDQRAQYSLFEDETLLDGYDGVMMTERQVRAFTAKWVAGLPKTDMDPTTAASLEKAARTAWKRHQELLEAGPITVISQVNQQVLAQASCGDTTTLVYAWKVIINLSNQGLRDVRAAGLKALPSRNAMKGVRGVLTKRGPMIIQDGEHRCSNCRKLEHDTTLYEPRGRSQQGNFKAIQLPCGQAVNIGIQIGDAHLVFSVNCFPCMVSNYDPCDGQDTEYAMMPGAVLPKTITGKLSLDLNS